MCIKIAVRTELVVAIAGLITVANGHAQERKTEQIILVRCKSVGLFDRSVSDVIGIDPSTGKVTVLNSELGREMPGESAAVSPDGKFIAFKQMKTEGNVDSYLAHLRPLGDPKARTQSLTLYGEPMCWSPDGRYLVVAEDEEWKKTCYRVDVRTLKPEAIRLPGVSKPKDPKGRWGHVILDWSPDGKWYLTKIISGDAMETPTGLYRVQCDTLEVKPIEGAPPARFAKLSPDGSQVLYAAGDDYGKKLYVIPATGGKPRLVSPKDVGEVLENGFCWSPDGKRIAFVDRKEPQVEQSGILMRLVVGDADGENPVVLLKSANPVGNYFCLPNWRSSVGR